MIKALSETPPRELLSSQQSDLMEFQGKHWEVTTLVGSMAMSGYEDGPVSSAKLTAPVCLAYGQKTDSIYFTDVFLNTVRKLHLDGNRVSTYSGTPKRKNERMKGFGPHQWSTREPQEYAEPFYIAADAEENLYVGDSLNFRVAKVTPDGKAHLFAGPLPHDGEPGQIDGKQFKGRFQTVNGVFPDDHGNVYVMDSLSRSLVTLRGDIEWGKRKLRCGRHLVVDKDDNVYVSIYDGPHDEWERHRKITEDSHCIKKITPGGQISMFAGSGNWGHLDGQLSRARFRSPSQMAIAPDRTIYVSDSGNNCIRAITPNNFVHTLAGSRELSAKVDGPARQAGFSCPHGITVDPVGNIYVGDTDSRAIRKISPAKPYIPESKEEDEEEGWRKAATKTIESAQARGTLDNHEDDDVLF
eukprot:jgi/Bigna1/132764/aug1.19_g7472